MIREEINLTLQDAKEAVGRKDMGVERELRSQHHVKPNV